MKDREVEKAAGDEHSDRLSGFYYVKEITLKITVAYQTVLDIMDF
jgi:hypothetical protein